MLKCKRIFSAAMAAFLCFSLTACSAQTNATSAETETASSDTITENESTAAASADNESTTQEYDMDRTDFHLSEFGENVYIFSPDDDPADIQKVLNSLWNKQETNQFGDSRYALYFLPGVYSEEISVKVGYYMQVAGLGAAPDDTTLHNLNCDARWLGDENNHNATCNFWRGVENLQITENVMWAVSQATFMRNMHIQGALRLHDENGWSSGGFLSNSKIDMLTDSGSQQQWLSRNCDWKAWMGQNWNMVFAGIAEGKAPFFDSRRL